MFGTNTFSLFFDFADLQAGLKADKDGSNGAVNPTFAAFQFLLNVFFEMQSITLRCSWCLYPFGFLYRVIKKMSFFFFVKII